MFLAVKDYNARRLRVVLRSFAFDVKSMQGGEVVNFFQMVVNWLTEKHLSNPIKISLSQFLL